MRLLYVADPFLPLPPRHYGGIERIVADLVRLAIEAGHEVACLGHRDSHLPGARFFPLAGATGATTWEVLRNAKKVQAAARAFRPDVIHSFARLAILAGVLTSPTPKIMSFQREPTPSRARLAARLARNSMIFTGCSESLTRRGRLCGGRWESICNGVDLDRLIFSPRVEPQAPLVFLSRIERLKGTHRAIAAARAAGRPLILAGNHATEGAEAVYWKKEVEPWIGRDGISHVGRVDDRQKSELLGRARALLVPVEWEEPFGIVFAEALACGTPVISTPQGALPEIIGHGREGFLAENDADLISAIENVAQIDRAACRRKAELCFDIRKIFRTYEDLYRRQICS